MTTVRTYKINMNRQIVWCYLFTLTLMEVIKTKVTEQGTSHGTESLLDKVIRYDQEFPLEGSLRSPAGSVEGLVFSPPALSFGARPLGAPHSERVTLLNHTNRTVQLTSISGNTMHFHSSFFEDKAIPPNGNTSFNVVFLGRERGHVDTSLFIHTSEGIHKYMMSGTSVASAYRLQPLVGVRLPHNASFAPLIYIHNPHDHPIQITEVYSSGGGVVLELPGGAREGPQALWRLPPHTTRPVIAVKYRPSGPQQPSQQGQAPRTIPHIAYVRIKVNGTQSVLVVAVEVYPSTEPGPYTDPHLVDFGMGGTRDPPKQMLVYMGNSSPRAVRVSSVTVRSASSSGSSSLGGGVRAMATQKLTLPPLSQPVTHVATLTMDWREAYESGQCCGKVIIRTKQGQHKIVLSYTSHVLSGGLTFDESVTRYLSCEPGIIETRQVMLLNEYKMGIYLTDIVLGEDIEKYFEVKGFWPKSIEPNESSRGFMIRLKTWTESLKFESKITVNTNISSVDVPVYIYNGKLDLSLSIPGPAGSPHTLDLGLVGASSTTRATLQLSNSNPAPVCLRGAGAELPGAALQLLGCTLSAHAHSSGNITACTCIPPGWLAVYSVCVVAPAREASLRGELWVQTQHERVSVPVLISSASGGRLVQMEPTTFQDCFPGTICWRPLRVKSTFPVDMLVTSVEATPPDPRLYRGGPPPGELDESSAPSDAILARGTSDLGWLHYDPYLNCDGRCYTGLDLNSTVGQQWLSRVSLPIDTLLLDVNLVNSLYSLYLNLTTKSPYNNLTVKLDTNQVRHHMLSMRVSHTWPRLHAGASALVEAPLAQVGRSSQLLVTLRNPSRSRPALLQLLVDWMQPEQHTTLPHALLPPDCPPHKPCSPTSSQRAFYFPFCSDHPSPSCEASVEGEAPCEEAAPSNSWTEPSWLPPHVQVHPDSCVFMLPPGGERNVTVAFMANYSARVSSLLYIRNNLTIIEVLRLSGQGVVPSLKFGNRKPGSTTPLLFDLTEKHLKDCDRDRTKKSSTPPNLTVKRTFVARNTGEIPIKINKLFINSIECEGYGFKVLNCEPFELLPNGTYKVDIAFTPDFTLTKVERTLILETSLNMAVNYSLVSSIPVSLAGRCAAILRRPPWEPSLRNAALSLLTCIGICILIAGFYDSDRILKMASVAMTRDRGIVHPPLDLRAIGQLGMGKKSDNWDCCPSTLEKKQKEAPSYKISSWSMEERNCLLNDLDCSQKYEELTTQNAGKNKKKLGKRNSNTSDANTNDSALDQEVAHQKDKKVNSKELNNSWKVVFSRGGILKTADKKGQSNESSDMLKLIGNNNTHDDKTNEKLNKLLDVPKKITNLFNGDVVSDNQAHNSQALSNNANNKKHNKNKCHTHSHSCEEDTSSTTTESSNNDEAEKENDNSTSSNKSTSSGGHKKACNSNVSKKTKKDSTSAYKDNYEGDGEDEDYDHKSQSSQSSAQTESTPKWSKNRDTPQSANQTKAANAESEKQKFNEANKNANNLITIECTPLPAKQSKKETYKAANNKKEKQPLSKKRSLDKSFIFGTKMPETSSMNGGSQSIGTFNVVRSSPTPLPVTPTVWENKASFSDVVARSDNAIFSNNYSAPSKTEEPRKAEQKPATINQAIANSSNPMLYVNKPEINKVANADLGPIGSYYPKKSPTSWMETLPEKQRMYNNANIPQPIKKPQPQKVNDDMGLVNNNNSFFLSSNSYFSGNSLSDITSGRNQAVMNNHIANASNNYANLSNQAMMMNQHNMVNENSIGLGINSMDSPKYGQMRPMLDMTKGHMMSEANMQMAGLDSYENQMTSWDRNPKNKLKLMGNSAAGVNAANESMFDVDYSSRNLYNDTKASGWGGGTSLWEQASSMGRATPITASMGQENPNTALPNNIMSGDRSQAEWLWGYGGGASGGGAAGGGASALGAIGSAPTPRPPPGLAPPTPRRYPLQQQQPQLQQQQQQAQLVRAFDPFSQHSLSSIWSPGSSLDRWANRDANNQDHQNQYQ